MQLNAQQMAVVEAPAGKISVIAGAGSGKTRVLIEKIVHEVSSGHIKPEDIVAITFTRKAAKELKDRLTKALGDDVAGQVNSGTIHSWCSKYIVRPDLQYFGFKNTNVRVVTSYEGLIRSLDVADNMEDKEIEALAHLFSRSLSRGVPLAPEDKAIFDRMRAYQFRTGCMSCDDIIWFAHRRLEDDAEFRKKISASIKLLMVDECQDNSLLQHRIALNLSSVHNNIVEVGDDGQCQPPGTLVNLDDGRIKPIEELEPFTDCVVSYHQHCAAFVGRGLQGRMILGKESREYRGNLLHVTVGSCTTRVTPNHKFLARYSERLPDLWVTYLMRRGSWFRVGWCQLFSRDSVLHLGQRARVEKADAAWVLQTHRSKADASTWESLVAAKYGLPLVMFEAKGYAAPLYSEENLKFIFESLPDLQGRAEKCLQDFGRDIKYPFYETNFEKRGRTTIRTVVACNLLPDVMSLPLYTGAKTATWGAFSVERKPYEGLVYSLEVETHQTYVADGILTHNSLYSWRAAQPEHFIGLKDIGFKVFKLETNYRSHQKILDLANEVMKYNDGFQVEKKIVAANPNPAAPKPQLMVFSKRSRVWEHDWIAGNIYRMIYMEGVKPSDIAIVCRSVNGGTGRRLQAALMSKNVRYNVSGGADIANNPSIRRLFCCFGLASGALHSEDWRELISLLKGVGEKTARKIVEKSSSNEDMLAAAPVAAKQNLSGLFNLIKSMRYARKDAAHCTELFAEWYFPLIEDDHEALGKAKKYLDTIANASENIELSDAIERFTLETDESDGTPQDRVTISTVHKYKGLEAPFIFVPDCHDKMIPHVKSHMTAESLHEECRVLYVAITRAKRDLCLTATVADDAPLSRFLTDEIQENFLDVKFL